MSNTDKAQKNNQNLWESILSEAIVSNNLQNGHLILLGNKNCGKRTFVNQIISNMSKSSERIGKIAHKGVVSALEYSYIMVKNPDDPDNELQTKLNVWIFDDPTFKDLLDSCIKIDTIDNMMICICIDLSEPWKIMQTLSEWINIVIEKLSKVMTGIPLNKQDTMRDKLSNYVKTYESPQFDEDGKLKKFKAVNESLDALQREKTDIPMPPGLLKVNYGVPIMILGMKSDAFEDLEKEKDGNNKMEYLNYTLRNYCLPYAASLIYTSSKQNSNLDIFYEYAIHRLFDFSIRYKAEVIHKDSLFIPSGYDNEKLLSASFSNFKTNVVFEEVFPQPIIKKVGLREEVIAEDHQAFLTKLKEKIGTPSQKDSVKKQAEGETPATGTSTTKTYFTNLLGTTSGRTDSHTAIKPEELMNRLSGLSGKSPHPDTSAKLTALLNYSKNSSTAPDRAQGSMGGTSIGSSSTKSSGATDKLIDILKKRTQVL